MNPYYGVERLALALSWSKNKTKRIKALAKIEVLKRTKNITTKKSEAEIAAPENALKPYMMPVNPSQPWKKFSFALMTKINVWCQDFTYLKYRGQWLYLATIIDLPTRRIVGWNLSFYHNSDLVCQALQNALHAHSPPEILYDDRGSEYLSYKMRDLCQRNKITLSCSSPASPWQNGFKESFYSNFKLELSSFNHFSDLGQVIEYVAYRVYYYNNHRIHTALKMSPQTYAVKLNLENLRTDKLLQKLGG